MAETTDELGCAEIFGLLILIAFLILVYGGWPASGMALGFLAIYGVFWFCLAVLEPEDGIEPGRRDRVIKGALTNGKEAALWSSIGCAIVWILQISFSIIEPEPNTLADHQLDFVETMETVRSVKSAGGGGLLLFALAFALAMAVGALWPIGLASRLSSWLGNLLAILTGMASFTFVAADATGVHYDPAADSYRAEIAGNLEEIVAARREGAAYHLLAALAEQEMKRPDHESKDWSEYFGPAMDRCVREEQAFSAGYRQARGGLRRGPNFCPPVELAFRLARERLAGTDESRESFAKRSWLPDFPGRFETQVERNGWTGGEAEERIVVKLPRLRDLRSLAADTKAKLEDAEKARDALRGVAVSSVSKLFGGAIPKDIEFIVEAWTDGLKTELAKKASGEIARRLRLTRLSRNPAIAALLGPDPVDAAVRLDGPSSARGTPEKQASRVYDNVILDFRPGTGAPRGDLTEFGRIQGQNDNVQAEIDAAREIEAQKMRALDQDRMREIAEKARRARGGRR